MRSRREQELWAPKFKWFLQVSLSNWEAAQLSPKQIKYAACDALLSHTVHQQFRSWLLCPSEAPICIQCKQRLGLVSSKGMCHVCSCGEETCQCAYSKSKYAELVAWTSPCDRAMFAYGFQHLPSTDACMYI
jgi:hypothetical protein